MKKIEEYSFEGLIVAYEDAKRKRDVEKVEKCIGEAKRRGLVIGGSIKNEGVKR